MDIIKSIKKTFLKGRPSKKVRLEKEGKAEVLRKQVTHKFDYITTLLSDDNVEIKIKKINGIRHELRRV